MPPRVIPKEHARALRTSSPHLTRTRAGVEHVDLSPRRPRNEAVPARATLQSGESAELGLAARRQTPRKLHADWAPASQRPDPVAVLAAQAVPRLPELVP